MTRKEIEEKVNEFLINEFEVEREKIYPDSLLKENLGIDSLDYVDLVVIIDELFGFKITNPSEMTKVKTLSQFYDLIETKNRK